MRPADLDHRTVRAVRRLRGPLDTDRFRHAVRRAVQRHDALRLKWPGGDPAAQTLSPPDSADVDVPVGPGSAAQAWHRAEQPLDLSDGPLRLELIRSAAAEHLLVTTEHDLASDGWSSGLLLTGLLAEYGGKPRADPGSYAEHVRAQRAAGGGLTPAQHRHWSTVPAAAPPLPAANTGLLVSAGATVLDPVRTAALRAAAVRWRATDFGVVLAAAAAGAQQQWGLEQVLLTTAALGRDSASARATVGLFHRLVDVPVSAGGSTATAARAASREVLRALQASRPPYSYPRMLAEGYCGGAPVLHRLRTGQGRTLSIAVEYVVAGPAEQALGDLRVSQIPGASPTARYSFHDLVLVAVLGDTLALTVLHDTGSVPAATARDFLAAAGTLLRDAPDSPPPDLGGS